MNKGVSLIEMLIVFAIISIILLIIFFSGASVNSNLALKEAADDIALMFRRAQIEGLAVLENPKSTNDFEVGYGIYFERGESDSSFVYYVDHNTSGSRNNVYDNGFSCNASDRECVEVVSLDQGVTIAEMCGVGPTSSCSSISDSDGMSVVFSRPRPEALILRGSGIAASQMYTSLQITLRAADGNERLVILGASGEVTIE